MWCDMFHLSRAPRMPPHLIGLFAMLLCCWSADCWSGGRDAAREENEERDACLCVLYRFVGRQAGW